MYIIDQYTALDDDNDSTFSITQSITLEGAITGKIRTLEEISIEFKHLARLKIGATSESVINSATATIHHAPHLKGFILDHGKPARGPIQCHHQLFTMDEYRQVLNIFQVYLASSSR